MVLKSKRTDVLIEAAAQRQIQEKRPCKDADRHWMDESTSQGMPRIADKYEKLKEARKPSPLEMSERAWAC